jgi:hypothetical protein
MKFEWRGFDAEGRQLKRPIRRQIGETLVAEDGGTPKHLTPEQAEAFEKARAEIRAMGAVAKRYMGFVPESEQTSEPEADGAVQKPERPWWDPSE